MPLRIAKLEELINVLKRVNLFCLKAIVCVTPLLSHVTTALILSSPYLELSKHLVSTV